MRIEEVPPAPQGARRRQILVIDDSEADRELLTASYEGMPGNTDVIGLADLPYDTYDRYDPWLVALDVHLGKTHGVDAAAAVQTWWPDAHIRVITGSENGDNEYRLPALPKEDIGAIAQEDFRRLADDLVASVRDAQKSGGGGSGGPTDAMIKAIWAVFVAVATLSAGVATMTWWVADIREGIRDEVRRETLSVDRFERFEARLEKRLDWMEGQIGAPWQSRPKPSPPVTEPGPPGPATPRPEGPPAPP